jgi:hypothetical protein
MKPVPVVMLDFNFVADAFLKRPEYTKETNAVLDANTK